MVKACLNQKIIKNSNLIKAMKNSVCPKAKVIRRPNFPESRMCPNIYRMFRNVDWKHDMIIVKWREVDVKWHLFNFSESRICPNMSEYLPNVPKCGLNTRHYNREVTLIHLFIWHKRKLCALTNAPSVQSTQTGQWLSTLFHARRSRLCLVPSAIHLRSKLQATIIFAGITIHKKDILKNFLCIWWWQMLSRKHVLTRKL